MNAAIAAAAPASDAETVAAGFEQRFAVYRDVESFLQVWAQKGSPNSDQLRLITGAWDRSHFLFDTEVTGYLRQIWLDAITAERATKILSGEHHGDRDEALKQNTFYMEKYFSDNGERHREVFMRQMKLQPKFAHFKRNW